MSTNTGNEQPTARELIETICWTGPSGEPVTGQDAARHLEATITLLDQRGWTRTWDPTTPSDTDPLAGADESWTTHQLVLALVRAVQQEDEPAGPLTASAALQKVTHTDDGDPDSWNLARQCLGAILETRTGKRYGDVNAWFEKRTRTYEQVTDLLRETAALAREYGPAAPVEETSKARKTTEQIILDQYAGDVATITGEKPATTLEGFANQLNNAHHRLDGTGITGVEELEDAALYLADAADANPSHRGALLDQATKRLGYVQDMAQEYRSMG